MKQVFDTIRFKCFSCSIIFLQATRFSCLAITLTEELTGSKRFDIPVGYFISSLGELLYYKPGALCFVSNILQVTTYSRLFIITLCFLNRQLEEIPDHIWLCCLYWFTVSMVTLALITTLVRI